MLACSTHGEVGISSESAEHSSRRGAATPVTDSFVAKLYSRFRSLIPYLNQSECRNCSPLPGSARWARKKDSEPLSIEKRCSAGRGITSATLGRKINLVTGLSLGGFWLTMELRELKNTLPLSTKEIHSALYQSRPGQRWSNAAAAAAITDTWATPADEWLTTRTRNCSQPVFFCFLVLVLNQDDPKWCASSRRWGDGLVVVQGTRQILNMETQIFLQLAALFP